MEEEIVLWYSSRPLIKDTTSPSIKDSWIWIETFMRYLCVTSVILAEMKDYDIILFVESYHKSLIHKSSINHHSFL